MGEKCDCTSGFWGNRFRFVRTVPSTLRGQHGQHVFSPRQTRVESLLRSLIYPCPNIYGPAKWPNYVSVWGIYRKASILVCSCCRSLDPVIGCHFQTSKTSFPFSRSFHLFLCPSLTICLYSPLFSLLITICSTRGSVFVYRPSARFSFLRLALMSLPSLFLPPHTQSLPQLSSFFMVFHPSPPILNRLVAGFHLFQYALGS